MHDQLRFMQLWICQHDILIHLRNVYWKIKLKGDKKNKF